MIHFPGSFSFSTRTLMRLGLPAGRAALTSPPFQRGCSGAGFARVEPQVGGWCEEKVQHVLEEALQLRQQRGDALGAWRCLTNAHVVKSASGAGIKLLLKRKRHLQDIPCSQAEHRWEYLHCPNNGQLEGACGVSLWCTPG